MWDKSGNFVVASVAWDIGTLFILEAKASAMKEAIEGVIAMHLDNVIFESDAQQWFKPSTPIIKGDAQQWFKRIRLSTPLRRQLIHGLDVVL